MKSIYELTLEEVLEKGMNEAEVLFNQDDILLAGYTLFLVKKRYSYENQPIPKIVLDIESKFDKCIVEKYPKKVKEALEKEDYFRAVNLFFSISLKYSRENKKLPLELYPLKELLVEKLNHIYNKVEDSREDQVFNCTKHLYENFRDNYDISRFEER